MRPCLIGSCVFSTFTFTILLAYFMIHYNLYSSYNLHKCDIVNVTYPTELPTFSDSSLWRECSCGKRCTSLTPCINLYPSVKNNTIILNKFYNTKDTCTVYNSKCPNGEDPRYTTEALENAYNIAQEYINSTTNCYYNKNIDYIFLEKKLDYKILAATCIFGIFSLTTCFLCMYIKISEIRNNSLIIV